MRWCFEQLHVVGPRQAWGGLFKEATAQPFILIQISFFELEWVKMEIVVAKQKQKQATEAFWIVKVDWIVWKSKPNDQTWSTDVFKNQVPEALVLVTNALHLERLLKKPPLFQLFPIKLWRLVSSSRFSSKSQAWVRFRQDWSCWSQLMHLRRMGAVFKKNETEMLQRCKNNIF